MQFKRTLILLMSLLLPGAVVGTDSCACPIVSAHEEGNDHDAFEKERQCMTTRPFDIVILTEEYYIDPPPEDLFIPLIEDGLLKEALEKRGYNVARKAWDDPDFDWCQTKAVIFRSCWDYHEDWDDWIEYLDDIRTKTKMINPYEIIKWNMDKEYFIELSAAGINIPEFEYVEAWEKTSLHQIQQQQGWDTAVIKPAVSAIGRDTYKVTMENMSESEALFQKLLADDIDMIVQPFQHSIQKHGETSLMVIGGKVTHAVRKVPASGEFRVQDDFGGKVYPHEASEEEIAFAENVIDKMKYDPTYARVDIFRDNHGNLALMELEMLEPELFFRFNPEAADALADELSFILGPPDILTEEPAVVCNITA